MKTKRYHLTKRGRNFLTIFGCTIIIIIVCLIVSKISYYNATKQTNQTVNQSQKYQSSEIIQSYLEIGPKPLSEYLIIQLNLKQHNQNKNNILNDNVANNGINDNINNSETNNFFEKNEVIITTTLITTTTTCSLVKTTTTTTTITSSTSTTSTTKIITQSINTTKVTSQSTITEKPIITDDKEDIVHKPTTDNTESDNNSSDNAINSNWDGTVLNRYNGVIQGPSGKESYYNCDMTYIINYMKNDLGYDYEYWIREDGVKMFGPYVMCAANLKIRPKGTIVQTSLGMAIVCDTGGFAVAEPYKLDIAVNW